LRLAVPSDMLEWFSARFGQETEIQRRLWEGLPQTEHLLAVSPTGSGKTMAVFFPVLLELLRACPAYEGIAVLYISPLKALNNDIQRNLLAPLEGLRALMEERGENANPVRIAVRSGDSTARERKAVETNPPEILATTPESVQILLLSRHAKRLFGNLRMVIIDEIHALAGTKRGAHLFALLELLEEHAPGFRRLALSATVRDEEECARSLGGYGADGRARPVTRVRAEANTEYAKRAIRLAWPNPPPASPTERQGLKDTLARMGPAFRHVVEQNRTTLFFTNSRRLAERMASLINNEFGERVAQAHHGSLSRELRFAVEHALKQGRLRAVVATSSLELGIDIGRLDAVVLIGSPTSVSGAIQRIGRAAHHPGGIGEAMLFPTHARDALEALALSEGVKKGELEEIRLPSNPLDVLAQFVLTASAESERTSEWLYARARSSAAFAALTRDEFEGVLRMLAGIAGGRRHPALPVRARYQDGVFSILEGTLFLLRTAGGTIPPRGNLAMRDAESKAILGELDEEFVWERRVGDTFRFANRVWRYAGMDDQGVLATELAGADGLAPFWRAEAADTSDSVLSELRGLLDLARDGAAEAPLGSMDADTCTPKRRERGIPRGQDEVPEQQSPFPLSAQGREGYVQKRGIGRMIDAQAIEGEALKAEIVRYIEGHRHEGELALPGTRCIVLEEITCDAMPGRTVCLLTARGGRINRTLAFALDAWARRHGYPQLRLHLDNDSLLISGFPEGRELIQSLMEFFGDFDEDLVTQGLLQSRHFGMRFRDAAARSLVLPRDLSGRFRPFWKFRERARRLLAELAPEGDLPLFREAARECVREILDIPGTARLAADLLAGEITFQVCVRGTPSPMAQGVLWARSNELLYGDDTPLRPVRSSELPAGQLGEDALCALMRAREGTGDGLLLRDREDILDWLRLRILVSRELFEEASALAGAEGLPEVRFLPASEREGPEPRYAVHQADLHIVRAIQNGDENASEYLSQWLRYRGPESRADIAEIFGTDERNISALLDPLVEDERLCILADGRVLTRENLDFVLRQARNARRQEVQTLRPLSDIPLFCASLQGVYAPLSGVDGLALALEKLFGCALPAPLWESEVLPLRIAGYAPSLLDELFAEGDLVWAGDEGRRVAFLPRSGLNLYRIPPKSGAIPERSAGEGRNAEKSVLPKREGHYSFDELLRFHATDSANLSARLWGEAFRGGISNTTWRVVRRGLQNGFRALPSAELTPGRAGFMRWRRDRPDDGFWFSLVQSDDEQDIFPSAGGQQAGDCEAPPSSYARPRGDCEASPSSYARPRGDCEASPTGETDPLAENARLRARLELLLRRWGVLSREIVQGSGLFPSWHTAYRDLVRMEMEGSVTAGRYFSELGGVQFLAADAIPLFHSLEKRAGSPFLASIYDPIFPPLAGLWQGIRRTGQAGAFVTKRGIGAILYAGGRRILLRDASPEAAGELADALCARVRARARTLTIKEIQGQGGAEALTGALLERGARRCVDGVELGWRS